MQEYSTLEELESLSGLTRWEIRRLDIPRDETGRLPTKAAIRAMFKVLTKRLEEAEAQLPKAGEEQTQYVPISRRRRLSGHRF
ncbi:hypothetical protein [Puniceicoccus vermicola]|uniref:Uncharacterized protein n=1 Tax=Puniceicoccus vermicola TaxID=388746 RepID=A0A7X1AXJ0_9BACT|nr:hypothetical protein [Puniceicoccus vermicola]MBC2601767.1 hypothetical protein [Puniceicoccus vermicola]